MISIEDIYAKYKEEIEKVFPEVYVSDVMTNTPPKFPFVNFTLKSEFRPTSFLSLNMDDEVKTFDISITAYSAKQGEALNEAYDLIRETERIMQGILFIETSCYPVPNKDTSIRRITAQFRRTVGGGDTL